MRTRLRRTLCAAAAGLLALPSGGWAADSDCPRADARPDEVSVDDYAQSLLCVINETRREWGRDELSLQRNLARAAAWHAHDMTENDYFAHTEPDGDTLRDRLERARFIPRSPRWAAGENLAAGRSDAGSPAAIVSAWMQSRGHRLNLLDSDYELAGIGLARGWPGPGTDDGALTIALELGWRRPASG